MSNGTFFLGFLGILGGTWLADCAYHGRPPLATLGQIIQDPQNTTAILDQTKGTATHTGLGTFIPSPKGLPEVVGGPPAKIPSGEIGKVVQFLEAQIGKPYKWGAEGPNAFDCSGLGYAAYKSIGVNIPRVTTGQVMAGTHVARANIRPGDAIFPYRRRDGIPIPHVFWAVGSGPNALCVEAPYPGSDIHYTNIYAFFTARRYAQ